MKKIIYISTAATMTALVGCVSTPSVREVELDRAPITSKLEAQDFRRTAEKMVESLLSSEGVLEVTGGKRPVLDIEPIKNRTTQHFDVVSITDSIRTQLLRSGKFRFMDKSTSGTDIEFMDAQANLGLTDPTKAIRPGKQSAAQLFLYGAVTEHTTKAGSVTDRYFKFTLNLKDLTSGELVWADEKEIRKTNERSTFGL